MVQRPHLPSSRHVPVSSHIAKRRARRGQHSKTACERAHIHTTFTAVCCRDQSVLFVAIVDLFLCLTHKLNLITAAGIGKHTVWRVWCSLGFRHPRQVPEHIPVGAGGLLYRLGPHRYISLTQFPIMSKTELYLKNILSTNLISKHLIKENGRESLKLIKTE